MRIFETTALIALLSSSCAAAEESQVRRRLTEDEEELGIHHYGFQSRIVGGTAANAANYEWSVNLGGCGGSLIYEDIVLTAAHCQPLFPDSARVGGQNRNNGERVQIVGNGTPHPSYNGNSQDYDFMLYKLAQPVPGKTPVQLNRVDTNPSPNGGDPLTVIGFGSTFEGGSGSFNLLEVTVNHVKHQTCNANYRGSVEEDIMFCAGVNGGGKDTCQGDSGGPIIDANGRQVGVTSWGNGCARDGFPGVYARVSAVYGWVQESICKMSNNPPSSCIGGETDNGSGNGNSNGSGNGNGNSNGNGSSNGNDSDSDDSNTDLVQPKGITIRMDVTYDEYPQENAWVLYNDDTQEELFFSEYGDVTTPGKTSETFTDMQPGRYVFLMLDEFWDGMCCKYGQGRMDIYQVFPEEEGKADEKRWEHNGRFWNAAGAVFVVGEDEDRRRSLRVESEDVSHSPYLPKADVKPEGDAKP